MTQDKIDSEMVRFRLYVAGDSPNSQRARANLAAICKHYLPDRHAIDIIDVYEHPERALQDNVLLTPQLAFDSAGRGHTIVGSLSDRLAVLAALGIEEPG